MGNFYRRGILLGCFEQELLNGSDARKRVRKEPLNKFPVRIYAYFDGERIKLELSPNAVYLYGRTKEKTQTFAQRLEERSRGWKTFSPQLRMEI